MSSATGQFLTKPGYTTKYIVLQNSENSNQQPQNVKDKYKLREASIKKRIEVEHRKKEPKKEGQNLDQNLNQCQNIEEKLPI